MRVCPRAASLRSGAGTGYAARRFWLADVRLTAGPDGPAGGTTVRAADFDPAAAATSFYTYDSFNPLDGLLVANDLQVFVTPVPEPGGLPPR